jgi:hypothetical protein
MQADRHIKDGERVQFFLPLYPCFQADRNVSGISVIIFGSGVMNKDHDIFFECEPPSVCVFRPDGRRRISICS